MLFVKKRHHFLQQTIFVQQQSIQRGTGPWATGLAAVMEAAQTGITGMMFVYVLLSVLSLSSLRGVRRCGGHHMVVSVFAWTRYRAVHFLLYET